MSDLRRRWLGRRNGSCLLALGLALTSSAVAAGAPAGSVAQAGSVAPAGSVVQAGSVAQAAAAPPVPGDGEAPIEIDSVDFGGSVAAPVELDSAEQRGKVVAPRPRAPSARWNGVVLLHVADGVGAGGQLRVGNTGVRASLSYTPQYYIVDEDPSDDQFARFVLTSTAQLNVDAFHLFGESERGMSLSYRYSTLLGHGLGLAYQSTLELAGQHFALSIPVIYYPAGSARVQREFGLDGSERVNFPFGPRLRYGIGVAWLF